MKREFDSLECADLLREAVVLLRSIDARLASKTGSAPPFDPLAGAIREFLGTGIAFSAGELIERGDDQLLEVTGTDPQVLGRALAKCRGVQRLGKDAHGAIWCIPDDG